MLHVPGFLKSFSPMYVFLPPKALKTSHVKGMHNSQIRQLYGLSISLYDSCCWYIEQV